MKGCFCVVPQCIKLCDGCRDGRTCVGTLCLSSTSSHDGRVRTVSRGTVRRNRMTYHHNITGLRMWLCIPASRIKLVRRTDPRLRQPASSVMRGSQAGSHPEGPYRGSLDVQDFWRGGGGRSGTGVFQSYRLGTHPTFCLRAVLWRDLSLP